MHLNSVRVRSQARRGILDYTGDARTALRSRNLSAIAKPRFVINRTPQGHSEMDGGIRRRPHVGPRRAADTAVRLLLPRNGHRHLGCRAVAGRVRAHDVERVDAARALTRAFGAQVHRQRPVISQSGAVSPAPVPWTGSLLVTDTMRQSTGPPHTSDADTVTTTGTMSWLLGQNGRCRAHRADRRRRGVGDDDDNRIGRRTAIAIIDRQRDHVGPRGERQRKCRAGGRSEWTRPCERESVSIWIGSAGVQRHIRATIRCRRDRPVLARIGHRRPVAILEGTDIDARRPSPLPSTILWFPVTSIAGR